MTTNYSSKIALLIDADNTSSKIAGEIISEAGKYGKVTIRRAYGDFTNGHLRNWKEELNKFAIRPMQKFAYVYGKNSTDSALIIDAMDIMHGKEVTGFCIASSDSDYTGLVLRIREQGIFVMGIGKADTAAPFQKACESFVFVENLAPVLEAEEKMSLKKKPNGKAVNSMESSVPQASKLEGVLAGGKVETEGVISKIDKKPIDISILERAVLMALDDEGIAQMSRIGDKIRTVDPAFDTRTYGFSNLSALFKSLPDKFEFRHIGSLPFIKPR